MQLSHVAMSVPVGGLSSDRRAAITDFYERHLGWREMKAQALPDRLTMFIGRESYLNIRERAEPMVCSGYEHFGVLVSSRRRVEDLWGALSAEQIALEPVDVQANGSCLFRFRHLLPLAIEVQYFTGLQARAD